MVNKRKAKIQELLKEGEVVVTITKDKGYRLKLPKELREEMAQTLNSGEKINIPKIGVIYSNNFYKKNNVVEDGEVKLNIRVGLKPSRILKGRLKELIETT